MGSRNCNRSQYISFLLVFSILDDVKAAREEWLFDSAIELTALYHPEFGVVLRSQYGLDTNFSWVSDVGAFLPYINTRVATGLGYAFDVWTWVPEMRILIGIQTHDEIRPLVQIDASARYFFTMDTSWIVSAGGFCDRDDCQAFLRLGLGKIFL